jgi:hypothetical protein
LLFHVNKQELLRSLKPPSIGPSCSSLSSGANSGCAAWPGSAGKGGMGTYGCRIGGGGGAGFGKAGTWGNCTSCSANPRKRAMASAAPRRCSGVDDCCSTSTCNASKAAALKSAFLRSCGTSNSNAMSLSLPSASRFRVFAVGSIAPISRLQSPQSQESKAPNGSRRFSMLEQCHNVVNKQHKL